MLRPISGHPQVHNYNAGIQFATFTFLIISTQEIDLHRTT